MTDDGWIRAWHGADDQGWAFDVMLRAGQPFGEIRFTYDAEPKFSHPLTLEDIAAFYAERWDLLMPFVEGLIAQHRPQ